MKHRPLSTMTPQQALQLLDNAAAQARMTRTDHIAVQEALAVLNASITAKPEAKTTEPTGEPPTS